MPKNKWTREGSPVYKPSKVMGVQSSQKTTGGALINVMNFYLNIVEIKIHQRKKEFPKNNRGDPYQKNFF